MIRLYILTSNLSSRKAVEHLKAVGQDFVVRNMLTQPLTFEELKDILSYTENGVDDIVTKKGKVYEELVARGIDIEELPLSKLYHYIKSNPRLIKAPITIGNGVMEIGYNQDDYPMFNPRGMKIKTYMEKLAAARREEDSKLSLDEPISEGYWGKDDTWVTTSLEVASH